MTSRFIASSTRVEGIALAILALIAVETGRALRWKANSSMFREVSVFSLILKKTLGSFLT